MRSLGIVVSGIAGLLCAHALRRHGYAVTVYSDRTAQAWLDESRPTGTAGRFHLSLAFERELGLDHFERPAPKVQQHAMAVDVRLQSHRWMLDLVERGG